MRILAYLTIGLAIICASCTDAGCGKVMSLGDSAHVRCYSGGKVIFEGRSTGKVKSEQNSDGYFFKDSKDGIFKLVSGECIIEYKP